MQVLADHSPHAVSEEFAVTGGGKNVIRSDGIEPVSQDGQLLRLDPQLLEYPRKQVSALMPATLNDGATASAAVTPGSH